MTSSSRAGSLLGASLILVFAIAAGATLDDYGVTWDEALGDLYFGDVYLDFYKSGFERDRLPAPLLKPPEHWALPGQPAIAGSLLRDSPFHHWPVANIVVAAFGEIFDRRLHLLGPIEARHLGIVFLAALALAATWTFAREVVGTRAAAASVLILGSFPEFFSLSHNVVKDVGECAFYAWTIVAFYRAHTRRSVAWLACAAVFFGLALGTKLNAVFALATIVVWLGIQALVHARRWWPRPDLRALWSLAAVVAAGAAIYVLSWPWLWPDVLGRLDLHLRVFREVAAGGPPAWQIAPLAEAFVRTPPAVLAAFAAGGFACLAWKPARAQGSAVLLLVLWLAIPLVRSMAPGFRNYDGIRRFLEYLPAFAIVCGAGVAAASDVLGRRLESRGKAVIASVLAILVVAHSIWIDTRLHPHQAAYLNPWRGQRVPGDYWGSSLREGLRWVNAHAESRASVFAPVGQHMIDVMAPVVLRPDLEAAKVTYAPTEDPILPERPFWPSHGRPRYAIFLNRPDWSERAYVWLSRNETERYRIEVDGHPILLVYQLRPGLFEPETQPNPR